MTVVVDLAVATICFLNQCYPALVGTDTPKGQYQLVQRFTEDAGYGGDVLKFYETKDAVYAIHRVWLLKPSQKRLERLKSPKVKDHFISSGCINVDKEVYEKLVDCCGNDQLIIK